MKKFVLYLFFSFLWQMNGFSQKMTFKAIVSSKHWLDIDYVGDKHIGHRLDIHLPSEGKAPFPVVMVIYGSAWFSNSSKSTAFDEGLGQKLLENGFAVVTINHRSSKDALFPAQIHDVKAAIRFVRANAEVFSLNQQFIGLTGWSSGGHLSAFTGITNGLKQTSLNQLELDIEGNLGKYMDISSKVDAVVDWFGPTDFLSMDTCGSSFSHDDVKSPESSLVGGAIQDNKNKVALANPINFVRSTNPPFLIFHGDKDELVPHCQSEKLIEKLRQENVESTFYLIEGGKHGPGVMIDVYYEKMIAFFKKHVESKK